MNRADLDVEGAIHGRTRAIDRRKRECNRRLKELTKDVCVGCCRDIPEEGFITAIQMGE